MWQGTVLNRKPQEVVKAEICVPCSSRVESSGGVVVGTVTTKLYSHRRSSRKNPLVISTCQFYKFDARAVRCQWDCHTLLYWCCLQCKNPQAKKGILGSQRKQREKRPSFLTFSRFSHLLNWTQVGIIRNGVDLQWWLLLDTIYPFYHPMGVIKTMVFHLSTLWVLFGPWFSVIPSS